MQNVTDEFSSEAGSSDNVYDVHDDDKDVPSIGKCRVVYDYDKNLFDELTIRQGKEEGNETDNVKLLPF